MTSKNRTIVATAASAVLIVAVTVFVLTFGIVPTPSFPSLREQPDDRIAGTIAYVGDEQPGNNLDPDRCVFVIPANGREEPRRLRCGDVSTQVQWLDDGRLAIIDPDVIHVTDATTGTVTETIENPLASYRPITFAETFDIETDPYEGSGKAMLRDIATREELLSISGPDDYWFQSAAYSPDKRWLWAVDSQARLLVAEANGDNMRELATLGEQGSWYSTGFGRDVAWYQDFDKRTTVNIQQLRNRVDSSLGR